MNPPAAPPHRTSPGSIRGIRPLRFPFVPTAISDGAALALVAAAAVYCWPGRMSVVIFVIVAGAIAGFLTFRRRPASGVAQLLCSLGIPLLLAWFFVSVMHDTDVTYVGLATIPAAALGASAAEWVERWKGPTRAVRARAWRGVTVVGSGSGSGGGGARPGGLTFDVSALTSRIGRRAVREFFAAFRRDFPAAAAASRTTPRWVLGTVLWLLLLGPASMAIGVSQEIADGADDMVPQLIGMSAFGLLMLTGLIVLIWWFFRTGDRLTRPADHLRLATFARDNALGYDPGPQLAPDGSVITRMMVGQGGRQLRLGNFELTGQMRTDGRTHFGGECAIKLGAAMPHISLLSTGHRTPALAAYAAPARDQRLSLEGDFNRHYELYCPSGYERDALYLFTPDVMARLIDEVHGFDVELRDDWLILHSRADVVTLDPAVWASLAGAINGLTDKIAQWERWRDDRADSPPTADRPRPAQGQVAPQGRRLRSGVGAGALLAAAFAAVYLGLTVLANVL